MLNPGHRSLSGPTFVGISDLNLLDKSRTSLPSKCVTPDLRMTALYLSFTVSSSAHFK